MFQSKILRMVVDPHLLSERSYIILPFSRFVRQVIHTPSQKKQTARSGQPLTFHLQIQWQLRLDCNCFCECNAIIMAVTKAIATTVCEGNKIAYNYECK